MNQVEINEKVITSLSAKYESNGDPACIADNAGDLGGTSYGKYQFASNVGRKKYYFGSPKSFCQRKTGRFELN